MFIFLIKLYEFLKIIIKSFYVGGGRYSGNINIYGGYSAKGTKMIEGSCRKNFANNPVRP